MTKRMTFQSLEKKLHELPPRSNRTFWNKLETNKPKTKKDKQYYYNLFYRVFDEEVRKKYRDILKEYSLPLWEGVFFSHFMFFQRLDQEERTFYVNEIDKRETTI